jgi:5-methyltetrahydrofolate--homocysteine methyltransferase
VNFDIDHISGLTESALDAGISAYDAVAAGMAEGMKVVGQKYQQGEFFLADLLLAAETFKEGMRILGPHLKPVEKSPHGRVVIGTVEGDLHDIGKNLVKYMLDAAGFEVEDLGVDVEAVRFASKARAFSADVIALSALISTAIPRMKEAVETIRESGLSAKTIVGGATLSMEIAKSLGADGYGKDAVEGVNICSLWAESFKR